VRIVLFTDVWLSPVSRQASHVLVSRTVSSSPFDSFAPMFALVQTIVAAVSARLGADAQRRVAQTEALLGRWTLEPEA
jgi:DNA-binding MurR/RpiR family transcriptional regulator